MSSPGRTATRRTAWCCPRRRPRRAGRDRRSCHRSRGRGCPREERTSRTGDTQRLMPLVLLLRIGVRRCDSDQCLKLHEHCGIYPGSSSTKSPSKRRSSRLAKTLISSRASTRSRYGTTGTARGGGRRRRRRKPGGRRRRRRRRAPSPGRGSLRRSERKSPAVREKAGRRGTPAAGRRRRGGSLGKKMHCQRYATMCVFP